MIRVFPKNSSLVRKRELRRRLIELERSQMRADHARASIPELNLDEPPLAASESIPSPRNKKRGLAGEAKEKEMIKRALKEILCGSSKTVKKGVSDEVKSFLGYEEEE